MSQTEITFDDVKRMRLEPGDALVLTIPTGLSFEAINFIRQGLTEKFPDHAVIVLSADMELEVVSRA